MIEQLGAASNTALLVDAVDVEAEIIRLRYRQLAEFAELNARNAVAELGYSCLVDLISAQLRCDRAEADTFRDAMHNAANFAFANRLFLALMLRASLEEVLGDVDFPLIYDAPHNLVWREEHNGHERWVHRKGACPARGSKRTPQRGAG